MVQGDVASVCKDAVTFTEKISATGRIVASEGVSAALGEGHAACMVQGDVAPVCLDTATVTVKISSGGGVGAPSGVRARAVYERDFASMVQVYIAPARDDTNGTTRKVRAARGKVATIELYATI